MQQKLQDIQQHFQTTRERTKKLLEEKDAEVAALRGDLASHKTRKFQLSSLNRHSTSNSTSMTPQEVSSEQHGRHAFCALCSLDLVLFHRFLFVHLHLPLLFPPSKSWHRILSRLSAFPSTMIPTGTLSRSYWNR